MNLDNCLNASLRHENLRKFSLEEQIADRNMIFCLDKC